MDLVIKTTSDWTELNLSETPVAVLEQKTLRATENLRVSGFHISQPEPDSVGASISYRVVLPEPLPRQFELTLTKGDIGWTTASLYEEGREDPLIHVENMGNKVGDPINERTEVIKRTDLLGKVSLETYDLEAPDTPKRVLAFYYPWYGNPDGPSGEWVHWDPSRGYSSSHQPVLGYYDSQNVETIREHVKWAKGAGIDAFIFSWWRIGDSKDVAFVKMLEVCEEERFRVCVYMEKGEGLKESLRYLNRKYFNSSRYLKIAGKPVVLYYERAQREFGMSNFAALFEELAAEGIDPFDIGDGYGVDLLGPFDGCHSYNPVFAGGFENLFTSASLTAHVKGKLFAATVVPGYDQTVTRDDGRFLSRHDGRLYERMWKAAIEAESDWVFITSFNEWHEGTEIEPSKEFGTHYLNMTEKWAKKFK